MKSKKLLVASIQEVLPIIERVYVSPEFSFKFVTALDEAREALDEDFDAIACGVHFNKGQFYEFLRLAKAHPKANEIPFVVVLTGHESAFDYVSESVEIASMALGAEMVIPVSRWRDELGDELAIERCKQTIHKVLIDAEKPSLWH